MNIDKAIVLISSGVKNLGLSLSNEFLGNNSSSPFPKYIKPNSYPVNNNRGYAAKQKRAAKKEKRK